jgi:hypothetical protein
MTMLTRRALHRDGSRAATGGGGGGGGYATPSPGVLSSHGTETERLGRVVSIPASYLEGPGFKSRPEAGYPD